MPILNVDYGTQIAVTTGQQLNIVVTTGAQRLCVAFASGPPGRDGLDATGVATGLYYPLYDNPSGYLNTLSGVSLDYINDVSGALAGLITASNAGVSTLNGLSGFVNIFGTGNITVFNDGQNIILSGAGSSVTVDVSGYITTGDADLRYYPLASNPSGYLTTLSGLSLGLFSGLSGVLVDLIGETGSQSWNAANNNAINLSGGLYQTGAFLYDFTTGLSGYLANLTPNISGYITTGEADLRYYPLGSNPSGYLTSLSGISLAVLSGASGTLAESIAQTGSQAWNAANNNGINLSGDLFNTGSVLTNTITGLSGYLSNLTPNISGYITTGEADERYYSINNPSGFITGVSTGNFITREETGQFASVTNLYQTGADLFALISASSAGVGSLNALSGAISLVGEGNVSVTVDGQNIIVSGNTGAYANFATVLNLFNTGSNLYNLVLGLSGTIENANYYPSSNPSGFITGIDTGSFITHNDTGQFASATSLYQTGADLFALISASSAGVGSLNSLSGAITLAGAGNVSISIDGQTIIVSGNTGDYANFATVVDLFSSGENLYNLITGLSGVVDNANYYPSSNPSGYITGISTGDFVTRSETGQFASVTNLFNSGVTLIGTIINSGNSAIAHANGIGENLSGNLAQTGSTLDGKINSLSGFTNTLSGNLQVQINELYPASNPSGYITGVSTGDFITRAETGQFASANDLTQSGITLLSVIANSGEQAIAHSNGIGTNLSGNLFNTGELLYNLITGSSGQAQNDFATKVELTQSGIDLQNIIISSGNSAVIHANGIGSGLSGHLAQTGSILDGKINLLSGYSNNTFATIVNLTLTGQVLFNRDVTISGAIEGRIFESGLTGWTHSQNNAINLSGNLTQTGQFLLAQNTGLSGYLIGLINAASAGVSSLNGQSGVMTIEGTGGISIFTVGQTIFISGEADPTFFATVPFVTGISGALQSYINSLSGLVDTNAQNSLNNAINLSGNLGATGSALYNLITGQSGQAIIDFATKVELTQTGIDLIVRDNAISGVLQGQINELYPASNPSGYITGISTGNFVTRAETGQFASVVSLVESGNSAVAHANGIGVSLSGAINGASGVLQGQINELYPSSNPSGYITGVSTGDFVTRSETGQFASVTSLFNSGVTLIGIINDSGDSTVVHANGIGSGLSGNLTQTGSTLDNKINSLSGFTNILSGDLQAQINELYPSSNPSGYITGISTGNFVTRSETGQFYPASNPQEYATSGDISQTGTILYDLIIGSSGQAYEDFATRIQLTQSGIDLLLAIENTGSQSWNAANNNAINLSGNLAETGANILTKIDSLSGFSVNISGDLQGKIDELYPRSNPSGYITGVSTGDFITRGETGQFYPASNPQGYSTSGNLQATGSNLYNIITGLSGQSIIDFATKIQLTQSGIDLITRDNSISGSLQNQINELYPASNPSGYITGTSTGNFVTRSETGQFYPASNPQQYTTSGNLFATGSILDQKINSLSGFTLGASGGLETRLVQTGNSAVTHANGIGINLSGNLTATGVALIARDNAISGILQEQINLLYPASNPSGFITGISTGDFITRGETGQFASVNQLINSGAAIIAHADGIGTILSGNLTQSGIDLLNIIANTGQQSWNAANNNGINLSGNLTQTGQTLHQQTTGLSGYLISLIGASSAGVASLNGRSGVVTLVGAGTVDITEDGQTITISGSASSSEAANQSGLFIFETPIETGVSVKFIPFPVNLETGAIVLASVKNNLINNIVALQISGVTTSGYWGVFSETLYDSGYYVNSLACNSGQSGGATIIINQFITSGTGSSSSSNELILPPIVNNSSTLNLGDRSFYIHTGYTNDTWILPTAVSSLGKFYFLKNKGADITLTGASELETLFSVSEVLSMTIFSGESYIVASSAENQWEVM